MRSISTCILYIYISSIFGIPQNSRKASGQMNKNVRSTFKTHVHETRTCFSFPIYTCSMFFVLPRKVKRNFHTALCKLIISILKITNNAQTTRFNINVTWIHLKLLENVEHVHPILYKNTFRTISAVEYLSR